MRDYAKVAPSFWLRGSGKRLRGDADALVLAMYLLTCPSANMIGVYYVPLVTIAHETGLGESRAREALARVEAAEFAFYDHDAELAWVPNMAAYQIGEEMKAGDKRRGAVDAELRRLGEHRFVRRFVERYGAAWRIAAPDEPKEAPSEVLPSPSEGASEGHARSSGRVREEKEEEQELRGIPSSPSAPPVSGTTPGVEDEKPKRRPKAPPKRLPRTFLAPDWQPPNELADLVRANGLDLAAVVADFVDHWRAKGEASADWGARFRQNVQRILRTDWLIARFAGAPDASPRLPHEPSDHGPPATGPEAAAKLRDVLSALDETIEAQTPRSLRGLETGEAAYR